MFSLALLIATSSLAGTPARQAPQPAAQVPRCPLPSVADTVTLDDVPGSDLKTVPVTINGTKKRFLLDVGAGPTEVSRATASALHLPRTSNAGETLLNGTMFSGGSNQFRNFSMGTEIQGSIAEVGRAGSAMAARTPVWVGTFVMGSATGHNLQFVLAKDAELGTSKPYDGLMTGSFFKQYDTDLDFYADKLSYLTPTRCTDPDQVVYWPHTAVAVIPMTLRDGKIQVEVTAQGHSIPAVLDTSSPQTVMRRDIAESIIGLKADTPEMMPDGDVRDGLGLPVYRHTFPQISFAGGVTALNVPALIQSGSMERNPNRTPILGSRAQFSRAPEIPALTLGMDVLHQLHIYVASGQQKLYVTAAQ